MPNSDGTGPTGDGKKTGKGRGPCVDDEATVPVPGKEPGSGLKPGGGQHHGNGQHHGAGHGQGKSEAKT